ncbi:MAG: hypothetical protein WC943_08475 [Elusimicrobiota bacterium]|jgi:hypothetical protein
MPGPNRGTLLAGGALLGLYLLSCNAVMFGQYVDDMNWLLFAEQMLKGSLLRAWHHPPQLEVSMNWGVPALLMPFLALFGRPVLLLKLFMACLSFSGLFLLYLTVRDRFLGPQRWALLSLLFLCDFTLTFSGNIMGEPGYLFILGLIAFLLFKRSWSVSEEPWLWACIGALAGFLVLLRSIGAAASIAILLQPLLARRWRPILWFFLGAAAAVLPCALYLAAHLGQVTFYGFYWAPMLEGGLITALGSVLQNAHLYLKGLTALTALYLPTFASPTGFLEWAFMAGGLVLFAAGAWNNRLSGLHRFLALYCVGHFLVCAGYSYQAPRYIAPMVPAFVILCLEGLRRILPERFHNRALLAAAALALASNLPGLARTVRTSLSQPLIVPHAAYDWLKAQSRPDDRVVSLDMVRINYFTGLKGSIFLPSSGPRDFTEKFRSGGYRWIVVRDAGFIPTAKGVTDPTRLFYDRLAAYAADERSFELVRTDEAEGVSLYTLRNGTQRPRRRL